MASESPSSDAAAAATTEQASPGSVSDGLTWTNSILIVLIGYLLYKLLGKSLRPRKEEEEEEPFIIPDPLPKHDMTLDELRKYDGKGPDKRICIAILGRVYDCTKSYHFYGPTGPYKSFAGHDATRALGTFDVMAVKEEWDDVSDLTQSQIAQATEWREQFDERYDFVGKLVRTVEEIDDSIGGSDEVTAAGDAALTTTRNAPVVADEVPSSKSSSVSSDVEVIDENSPDLGPPTARAKDA